MKCQSSKLAMPFLGSLAAMLAIVATADAPVSGLQPELRELLSKELGFSSAELADLQSGKAVAHGLDAPSAGEIAAVGAVRVQVGREKFLERYRDIVRFKRGADVLQIGRFSHPPRLEDLGALTLSKQDVDLRNCRVGDCDIRLPAAAIDRFHKEIDWKARDADARAAALFKQVLLDHVLAPLSGGRGRILSYDDEKRPVRPGEDFAALLDNSPYLGRLAPGLPAHLKGAPSGRLSEPSSESSSEPSSESSSESLSDPLPGAEDFLYWSKEKFGFTPFVTVTQVTIVPSTSTRTIVASRDVYSSRYFDASLTITIASDVVGATNEIDLVYINRSRASALKGTFAAVRRSIVEGRVKSGLKENLRTVKRRLEENR
jgi:hypothetical protein